MRTPLLSLAGLVLIASATHAQDSSAVATTRTSVDPRRAAVPAPLRKSQDATSHQCYNPGTPGTPDIVIAAPQLPPTILPGAPGTPDIVIPAPQLPPTIIPGTPATLGSWYSCP